MSESPEAKRLLCDLLELLTDAEHRGKRGVGIKALWRAVDAYTNRPAPAAAHEEQA